VRKLVYIPTGCDFCTEIYQLPDQQNNTDMLVKGRVYTEVGRIQGVSPRGTKGEGVMVAEHPLPPNCAWCSCNFRDVDGDAEEWQKLVRENKHKPKVLEPC
jgi:hypothetical protein